MEEADEEEAEGEEGEGVVDSRGVLPVGRGSLPAVSVGAAGPVSGLSGPS
ncbi:hypothetical protein GCM10022384_27230 [Streptomyces marokkonensis]|uniref:Uncharacterized protein n=1 Tax=Streptomyces marokkonensis TaxID=324855 RepID=A0ABP7Q343_9ACTN